MSRTSKLPTARNEIRHPDDLAGLSVLPWKRVSGRGQIAIDDSEVDDATRRQWEQRLNRLYFACGCPEGAVGVMIALAAYVVVMGAVRPDLGSFWSFLALGAAATIAGGLVGKLVGLRAADRKLQLELRDIRNEWNAPPRPAEEKTYLCG